MKVTELRWSDVREVWNVGETETHFVDIAPMLFNHRVVMTPKNLPMTHDGGWCYPTKLAALAAVAVWNPDVEPEPVGYIKRV